MINFIKELFNFKKLSPANFNRLKLPYLIISDDCGDIGFSISTAMPWD
jgi:hypothetical protein